MKARLQQIEIRLGEIAKDVETRSAELTADELAAFEAEVAALKTERGEIKAKAEQRTALLSAIAEGREPGRVLDTFTPHGGQGQEQRTAEAADPYDTTEYRNAFMQFCKDGTPIPVELRATTATTDVQAVIPTTTLNEIVRELKDYGGLFASVRKMNVPGGVAIPILSMKPKAHWIGEKKSSEDQKLSANDKVSFNYHGLECKISQTLLSNVTTYSAFQDMFVPLAVEAMSEALDIAIVNGTGDGQPNGVTKDSRVKAEQTVVMSEKEFASWTDWKKKVFAKMPLKYRKGNFYMAASTFDGHVDGMVDANGQPIGRVNYGTADAPTQRFGGKTVVLVEDDVVKPYDTAEEGDIVAVFFNPQDYCINTNMQMQIIRWTDHDTNEIKDKAIMICDGKLIDPHGVLLIKKGAAAGK